MKVLIFTVNLFYGQSFLFLSFLFISLFFYCEWSVLFVDALKSLSIFISSAAFNASVCLCVCVCILGGGEDGFYLHLTSTHVPLSVFGNTARYAIICFRWLHLIFVKRLLFG